MFKIVNSGKDIDDSDHPAFIFILFQTLSDEVLSSSLLSNVTHLIIDETHHLLAPTYNQIYNKICKNNNISYILGITATLRHSTDPNGVLLRKLFHDVVYVSYDWKEAKNTHFPKLYYFECLSQNNIKKFGYYKNDIRYIKNSLKNISSFYPNNNFIYKCYKKFENKKKILIFVFSVTQCENLKKIFEENFVNVESVHYKKNSDFILDKFKNGDINVLITVMKAVEGYDVKGIDMVILGRPTNSEVIFVQQIGRGLRKEGNKEVVVLDLCFNLRKRWFNLSEEIAVNELYYQMNAFWEVDTLEIDCEQFE